MVALLFKPGVVVSRLDTTLFPGLLTLCQIIEELTGVNEVWITSVNEGPHKSQSLHYAGRAVDIRSKWYPPEIVELIVRRFKEMYTSEYDLIWEDPGKPNEHLHLQFSPEEDTNV